MGINFNALSSGLRLLNFIQIAPTHQSYDVTSDFQDGGRGIAISLIPISCLVTWGRNLSGYQISVTFLQPRLRYYYFNFCKQRSAMLEFYFRLRFSHLRHRQHVILNLPHKFLPNRNIRDRAMTSFPFSRWRPQHRNSTSGFVFRDLAHLGRSKSTCKLQTKLRRDIAQSTAEILILPVSENKRPPCWKEVLRATKDISQARYFITFASTAWIIRILKNGATH